MFFSVVAVYWIHESQIFSYRCMRFLFSTNNRGFYAIWQPYVRHTITLTSNAHKWNGVGAHTCTTIDAYVLRSSGVILWYTFAGAWSIILVTVSLTHAFIMTIILLYISYAIRPGILSDSSRTLALRQYKLNFDPSVKISSQMPSERNCLTGTVEERMQRVFIDQASVFLPTSNT